uniref:WD repeat domain 27 n=1 Tax=Sphenodon punctatus TaxID=8508 RepID=A0A8D0G7K9_SPHPU
CRISLPFVLSLTPLSVTDIVLAAGSNRALEVFDLNAGCSTAVIPDVHSRSVHQICQNKVGRSSFLTILTLPTVNFVCISVDDGLKLCERRFEGHSNRCYPCGITISPCGRFIACGSEDKCAYIYARDSSTFSHKLSGHTESVINVAFSPSSPQVLSPFSPFLISSAWQLCALCAFRLFSQQPVPSCCACLYKRAGTLGYSKPISRQL